MVEPASPEAPAGDQASRPKGSGTVAALELMRGLASLDVFIWHVLNEDTAFPHIPGLYRVVGWSRESVIVFFVLSGYVISLSQQRKHRPAGEFFKARVKRILPIYLIALGAAVLVGYLMQMPLTSWQIIGHLLFLQSYESSFVPVLQTNGPLWSLGTEFEFYLLLTLIIALRKPVLVIVWSGLALAGVMIRYSGYNSTGVEGLLLEFLGLSPCWLLGYWFACLGAKWSFTLFQAVTLFLMVPMISYSNYGAVVVAYGGFDDLKCLFLALAIVPLIHTLAVRQLYPAAKPTRHGWTIVLVAFALFSAWALTHEARIFKPVPVIVMVILPAAFCVYAHAALPQKTTWPVNTDTFRRISIFMGGSSYALYAIHTPVMLLTILYVTNLHLRPLLVIVLVALAVLFLEYVVQPLASSWIDRIWKTPRAAR